MRRIFVIVVCFAFLLPVTAVTAAAAPMKRYPSCAALLKDFPAGVAETKRAADRAVKVGQRRPAVRPKVYRDNSRRLDRNGDGVVCEQTSPKSQRAVMRTEFGFIVAPYVAAPRPGQCVEIPLTFDIRNPDRVPTIALWLSLEDDFKNQIGGFPVTNFSEPASIRVCAEEHRFLATTYRGAKPGEYILRATRATLSGAFAEGEATYILRPRD
jgi:hypothetical protein